MNDRKRFLFICVCLILICISLGIRFYIDYAEDHYRDLYIDFIEPDQSYEIGSMLDAISFIDKTNAVDIQYPVLDTSKVGEQHYFYIAKDAMGNTKEFVLTLMISDPIYPIIELKEQELIITEGETIDLKKIVKRSYDPIDGDLPFVLEKPENYLAVGNHEVLYKCTDRNGNTTEAILRLVVKEKIKEVQKPAMTPNSPTKPTAEPENPQQPAIPNVAKPSNKTYMFSNGYDMQSAPAACYADMAKAYSLGYGAECTQILGNDGWPIGMQLNVY